MASLNSFALTARSDPVPIDPSVTADLVGETRVQLYISLSMLTLIIYNALTTFDKEVAYFWRRPVSGVGIVFFLIRYIGLLGIICQIMGNPTYPMQRQFVEWTGALGDQLTILFIDYVLLLRVLALYSLHKRLAVFMKLLFALEVVAFLAITVWYIVLQDITLGQLATGSVLCGQGAVPSQTLGALLWTIPLTYGTILMVLALYKATTLWKETEGLTGTRLVTVLIQDQILYYTSVIFCSVSNLVANAVVVDTQLLNVIDAVGNPALMCVLGSHLIIHLREAAERGLNQGTSHRWVPTISGIDFGLKRRPDVSEDTDVAADADA